MNEDNERQQFMPLDAVELAHGMAGMASAVWSFYSALIEEGFTAEQAERLTTVYIFGMVGGKIQGG